ncbi:MAG: ATPase domain-containing protein [Thermoplasmatales archaeon]|nr:ATPase domain-containing protein [Thermoplasmatales archaeon]
MKEDGIKRIKSGIPGLDEMIEGGFPLPSFVMAAGEPGTGKTTFAVQSLFHGAKNGERGVYITALSEPAWVVQKFLGHFTFYDNKLIETKKIVFLDIGDTIKKQPSYILNVLEKEIEKYSPKRIVIDPLTVMRVAMQDDRSYRDFLHDFMLFTKGFDCLTIVTGEVQYSHIANNMSAYMVDGVIILSYAEEENIRRKYLEVLKMRGTRHLTGRHSLDISKNGVTVQPGLR